MEAARIMIVEDERIVAKDIENILKGLGHSVTAVVASGEEAIEKAAETRPDLVLMDILLKGVLDGVKTAELIRSRFGIPIIYLTAFADDRTLQRAKITEPYGYIIKPFEERELRSTIEIALYRHKMEKMARESEQRFKNLFDSSLDGVFRTDADGVFTLINQAGAKILGYASPEEIVGKRAEDFWIDAREREVYISELRKNKSVSSYLVHGRLRGGETAYVEISSHILEDEGGNFLGTEGIMRDVTERKKIEEEIFRVTRDWEDTFNTITDMITVHDKDFNIIHSNKAAEKMLSLPSPELEKTIKCYQYYHGTECPPAGCPSCNCLKTGEPATFELFEPHLKMYIEIRAIPRFDSNKQLIGLIHVVRDITERKKAEEKLKLLFDEVTRGKREWELTFDSVTEIIVLVDKEFNIIRCNRSCADFCGMPLKTIPGHKFFDLFPWSPEEQDYYKEKIQQEEPTEWIETKTTTGRWFFISHRPIVDNNGVFLYSAIIATDITGMKNAQESLTQSEAELKKRVSDLEKFYDMSVGRELKMKELKKEIKRLTDELAHCGKDSG